MNGNTAELAEIQKRIVELETPEYKKIELELKALKDKRNKLVQAAAEGEQILVVDGWEFKISALPSVDLKEFREIDSTLFGLLTTQYTDKISVSYTNLKEIMITLIPDEAKRKAIMDAIVVKGANRVTVRALE